MTNTPIQVIEKFYFGFAAGDILAMQECYHPEVVFQDPIFGELVGNDAKDMWEMLIEKSKGHLEIRFSSLKASGKEGSANWRANYVFSSTNRPINNQIRAEFIFKDGLIYRHKDTFNLYNWSKQAFGLKGLLMGWMPFFSNAIRQKATENLRSFQRKKEKGLN